MTCERRSTSSWRWPPSRSSSSMGYDNIGIMLPLVQHPSELKRAKELMRECGIDLEKVDVGIMVEIPASALIIDDFIKEGIDFVSFGTNDLTQYTLAVDRNNELVADLYNELHPAVLKLIEYVIERVRQGRRRDVHLRPGGQQARSGTQARRHGHHQHFRQHRRGRSCQGDGRQDRA